MKQGKGLQDMDQGRSETSEAKKGPTVETLKYQVKVVELNRGRPEGKWKEGSEQVAGRAGDSSEKCRLGGGTARARSTSRRDFGLDAPSLEGPNHRVTI